MVEEEENDNDQHEHEPSHEWAPRLLDLKLSGEAETIQYFQFHTYIV